jgi:Pyruvate phosphate dikinase, AMP/ATP-binding domain
MQSGETPRSGVRRFERDFFTPGAPFTVIGEGDLGGKAAGLAAAQEILAGRLDRRPFEGIEVSIPFLACLTTEAFEAFLHQHRLHEFLAAEPTDEEITRRFLAAELPATFVGDLRALAVQVRQPLAVRSSSLLEDATHHPFAGVYITKMIPNSALDADTRFRTLVEAIRLVWASTFFKAAREYRSVIGLGNEDERMAVVIQEIVGRRFGARFYPEVSGVARSYNYYPSGNARPEDGVAQLALGLGKTIVDGDPAWGYSPAFPKAPPPYNDLSDLIETTQAAFWAVDMGPVPHDPAREIEYLVCCPLADAEADDVLRFVASTYDPHAHRMVAGTSRPGPRVVNFAPLLQYGLVPLNSLVQSLLTACEQALETPVEIEFALQLGSDTEPTRCGFLQVRPMVVPGEHVVIEADEITGETVLAASTSALGNGTLETLRDVVYVRPEGFQPERTPDIALEIERLNTELVRQGCPYLLIGFGRWGSSDSWGGVPVLWPQIGGARAIVEVPTDALRGEPSQGSHFFHNLTAFRVLYLSVDRERRHDVDWAWLDRQPATSESALLRHVRLDRPLTVKVDGRTRYGVVRHD